MKGWLKVGKEGWFFPSGKRVRVCHYGIEGRRRSLCGRFDTPGPHLLFPEVEHRKCIACVQRLEEMDRRRMEEKVLHLENKTDLVVGALMGHISNLLSWLEFARVERILEEIEKLSSETFEEGLISGEPQG